MEIKKCCFTGPRPNNLPWGYGEFGVSYLVFKAMLKHQIKKAIKRGFNYFLCGMALGVDTIAAKIILNLKKIYPHIILECALPCTNQSARWNVNSIKTYNSILEQADKVTYVSDCEYYNGCMQVRNEYMVNNSSLVIACYNDECGSGTTQTIRMALNQKKEVVFIKPLNFII